MYITLKGDENCKFGLTEQGYTVLQDENEQWYYAEEEEGKTRLSVFPLLPKDEESEAQKNFLMHLRKNIFPNTPEHQNRITTHSQQSVERNLAPVVGSRRVLVIMMQFKDTHFTKGKDQFDNLFNQEGYREDGALGSVRDYYDFVSYGKLQLHCDVIGPFTAAQNMAYYGGNSGAGGNDKNPYELFREAITQAVNHVNLRDYDADGDGYVDNVHIIYAGYGEEAGASSNAIWAHEMTFQPITVDGMKLDRYSCSPELRGRIGSGISRIGPHCHEIGHALGAMDYYDTDYDAGGYYLGTGSWDIMASGSWNNDGISPANFNPYVKIYNFGWTTAQALTNGADNEIKSSVEEGNLYRVDTGTDKDFFLLEYREGSYFDAAEPGRGLLIFHIGPKLEAKAATNTINSTYPQQCYVVCASSTYPRPSATSSSYGKIDSSGCPYPGASGNTSFSETSTPAAATFGGAKAGFSITKIKLLEDVVTLHYATSNTEWPDNPDTSDGTEQYESSWSDDFEETKLSDFWSYRDISGLGEFRAEKKIMGKDSPRTPDAMSGQGYASYRAINTNSIGRTHTQGCIEGKSIALDQSLHYELSFGFRRYSKLEDSSDKFILRIISAAGNEERSVAVTNSNQWETFSAQIPEGAESFRFEIEADIDSGAILFFDNFKLTPLSVLNLPQTENMQISPGFYDLWGRRSQDNVFTNRLIITNGRKMILSR